MVEAEEERPQSDESLSDETGLEAISEPVRRLVRAEIRETFSGPLPPPALLRQYEETLPGLADRIMSQAEQQSTHRIDLERRIIVSDQRRSWGGLVAGVFLALAVLTIAAVLTLNGHEAVGAIIGSVDVASVAAVFLVERRAARLEED